MKMKKITFMIIFSNTFLFSQPPKSIHIIVALCDNEFQGIVPVSDLLGNGREPGTNLYWGALFGVKTNVNPILLTTGLMAPESYILGSVFESWIKKESKEDIRTQATIAYNKYQKCGLKAAKNLFDYKW